MGIISGALGGLGAALQAQGARELQAGIDLERDEAKSARDMANYGARGEIDAGLAERRAVFMQKLQAAPLERMQGIIARERGVEVPQEAAPVTKFTGEDRGSATGAKGEALTSTLTGDPVALRKQVEAMPEGEDKTNLMRLLDSQMAGATAKNEKAVEGKTRARTKDEVLDAARETAMGSDLAAYGAFEKEIGKPLRDERRVDNQAARDEAKMAQADREAKRRADADARNFEVSLRKLDLQEQGVAAQNRKIDAWIDNEGAKRENDGRRADAKEEGGAKPERLNSIINSANQTIKNLDDSSKGKTDEAKAEWQRQRDAAVRVRDRATQLLDANLTDRGAPGGASPPAAGPAAAPSPAPAPAVSGLPPGAKQIGTSGGRPVYQLPDGRRMVAR